MQITDGPDGKRQKLNTEGYNTSLWLVKLPAFVADRWSYTDDPSVKGGKAKRQNGDLLGNMEIVVKDGRKQTVVTLDDGIELTLEDLGTNPNMLVFNKDEDGGFSTAGKITKHMALNPVPSAQYTNLVRNRLRKSVERQTVVAVDESVYEALEENSTMPLIPPVYTELKAKAQELKQSRKAAHTGRPADTTLLLTAIVSAFGSVDKLLFKELVARIQVDHPQVFEMFHEKELREELNKYATYLQGGPFKFYWMLKPDYKDHTARAGSSSGAGTS
jgi:hypothetical protein